MRPVSPPLRVWARSKRTHKVVGGHPVRLFGEERKQLVESSLHTGSERVLGRVT